MNLPALGLLALAVSGGFVTPSVPEPRAGAASESETLLVELRTDGRALDAAAVERSREMFVAALRASGAGRIGRTYVHLPYVTVVAPKAGGMEALAALPGVRRVHPRTFHRPLTDTEGLALIRQPAAVARGVTGEGTAVAVIDTGADYTHADLGGCVAPGDDCRVAVAEDVTDEDDGLPDGFMRHGTNVASIVAAVAPKTRLLVFDAFIGAENMAPDDAILAGLDRTLALKDTYNVVAVNISIGGRDWPHYCPDSPLAAGVQAVRAAGISVVAGSGNGGSHQSLTSPACIPGVVSVGNVYAGDVGRQAKARCTDEWTGEDLISCSSNASAVLALLAPGGVISAGGVTLSGTSQAGPHVAGAIALLRSETPQQPLDEFESRLLVSGKPVVDERNQVTYPRLDIDAALDASPDVQGPDGSLVINGGRAWTRPGTTLGIGVAAQDSSGAVTMCVTEEGTCDAFVPLVGTLNREVPEGVEEIRLNAWFKDRWSNLSGPFTARIGVDGVKPTDAKVTVQVRGTTVLLTGKGASDDLSGLEGFLVTEGEGSAPREGCLYAVNVAFGIGADTVARIEDLAPGSRHYFRYCTTDGAGNISPGVAVTVDIPVDARADDGGSAGDDAPDTKGCGCSGSTTGLLALAALGLRRRRFLR